MNKKNVLIAALMLSGVSYLAGNLHGRHQKNQEHKDDYVSVNMCPYSGEELKCSLHVRNKDRWFHVYLDGLYDLRNKFSQELGILSPNHYDSLAARIENYIFDKQDMGIYKGVRNNFSLDINAGYGLSFDIRAK